MDLVGLADPGNAARPDAGRHAGDLRARLAQRADALRSTAEPVEAAAQRTDAGTANQEVGEVVAIDVAQARHRQGEGAGIGRADDRIAEDPKEELTCSAVEHESLAALA